jgi:hypothetical protein
MLTQYCWGAWTQQAVSRPCHFQGLEDINSEELHTQGHFVIKVVCPIVWHFCFGPSTGKCSFLFCKKKWKEKTWKNNSRKYIVAKQLRGFYYKHWELNVMPSWIGLNGPCLSDHFMLEGWMWAFKRLWRQVVSLFGQLQDIHIICSPEILIELRFQAEVSKVY